MLLFVLRLNLRRIKHYLRKLWTHWGHFWRISCFPNHGFSLLIAWLDSLNVLRRNIMAAQLFVDTVDCLIGLCTIRWEICLSWDPAWDYMGVELLNAVVSRAFSLCMIVILLIAVDYFYLFEVNYALAACTCCYFLHIWIKLKPLIAGRPSAYCHCLGA